MRTLCLVGALLLVCASGVSAESQLPKRGTYEVRFFWQASGKWVQIETDRRFWVGEFNGTFFNDAGQGFFHRASGVCPGVRDVVKDVNAHGYCVITDEDGDTASLIWKCKGSERCEGDAEFLSGRGKYTGIRGRSIIYAVPQSTTDPDGSTGYAGFKGAWQLPE
jgi:hypothetical protein